jgi:hypothetical protein
MRRISFYIRGHQGRRAHDAALISDTEDPMEALVEAAIQHISTDVELELGGKTIFLAMLQDPEHWSSDWEERGIEDPDGFITSLVEEEA